MAAATVSGIQTINNRNISATEPATKEVAVISFQAIPALAASASGTGPLVISLSVGTGIGDRVEFTGATDAATSADTVAAYFAANVPTGYVFTSISGSVLTLTAATAGVATDIAVASTTTGGSSSTAGIPAIAITQGADAVAGANSMDAENFTGATSLHSDRSTGQVTIDNLASGQSAGMIGGSGALVANYKAAVTSGTVNVLGGSTDGAITLSGTDLAAVTLNSTGSSANTVGAVTLAAATTSLTIDAAAKITTGAITNVSAGTALKTVILSGAGAIDIDAGKLGAGVTTVDATGNSGGVSVALGSSTTQKVTGGTGNDVITAGSVLTTGSVDAGDGASDTLVLGANVSYANTAALAAKYTNFEVLRVNGTFDASLISGINAIELSDSANNISKLNATQAAAITARANIGNTTFALADSSGTSDVLSLTMGTGTKDAAATTAGALTINGFETLNVMAKAGPTATAGTNQTTTVSSFTADKLTAINLTGSAVTLSNAATTKAVTIDATALTGNGEATPTGLTISGNLVKGSTVNGSDVKDVFNLGTVGSTYNGNGGNDTFTATAVTQLRDGTVYNAIDGGAGTSDTLTLTAGSNGAVTMIDDDFKQIFNVEKITISATGTGAVSVTTGGWYDQNFKAAGSEVTVTNGAAATTFAGGSFSGDQKLTVTTTATTSNSSLTTGSGDDTVTVTGTAITTGALTVSTGAGDDAISVTLGTNTLGSGAVISLNGGSGVDTITVAGITDRADFQYVSFVFAPGESGVTAFDTVVGFEANETDGATSPTISKGMVLDFDGTATIASNVTAGAVTGYTSGELTYSVADGILTFAGTAASSLTDAQIATIAVATFTTNLNTVAWNSVDGEGGYVFNNNTSGDSLVYLSDLSADIAALQTGSPALVDNAVFIQ